MAILNAVIPILMHFFICSVEKKYYLHKAASAVSCAYEKRRYMTMCLKYCWMNDSVDPDKMLLFSGVWSGSTVFAQVNLYEYLR